jgi:transcription elongation GreA/GreB family factor
LDKIETEVARLSAAYAAAQSSADRSALSGIARDLRYWSARRASAEVVRSPNTGVVRFGSKVSLIKQTASRDQVTYRIVGEDEAEPERGTLSYVSPMARALMGRSMGDTVQTPGGEVLELVAIE